jgi:type VI secretion system protein ImpH
MADDSGTAEGHLTEDPLGPSLQELSFYTALRRIEHARRNRPRIGRANKLAEETVRLGQLPNLAFQSQAITSYEPAREQKPARLNVSFFGLWGANGPLPLHFTEYAQQRALHGQDRTLIGFANVFHHRMIALLYRAWADAQPTTSHDRPESDPFATFIAALVGIDRSDDGNVLETLDRLSMHMATHFVAGTRHPEGLCKLLSSYLGVPVELEEFVGEWLDVPDEYCWRLGVVGSDPRPGSVGLGARLGREKWERQFKFRLIVGPMARATYESLLPDGSELPTIVELVQRYAGGDISWDLRLVLKTTDMKPTRLGVAGRLGATSYLVSGAGPTTEKRWQDFTFDPTRATERTSARSA